MLSIDQANSLGAPNTAFSAAMAGAPGSATGDASSSAGPYGGGTQPRQRTQRPESSALPALLAAAQRPGVERAAELARAALALIDTKPRRAAATAVAGAGSGGGSAGGDDRDESELFAQPAFMFGTHYSYPGAALYFLLRVPHLAAQSAALHEGRFDVADRLFCSLPQAWDGVLTNAADVKELVPELFISAQWMRNDARIWFSRRQAPAAALASPAAAATAGTPRTLRAGALVDSVGLPPWARGSPERFMLLHRLALESDAVASRLPAWIDLVFGCRQRGAAAVAARNLFSATSYERGQVEAAWRDADADVVEELAQRAADTPHSHLHLTTPTTGSSAVAVVGTAGESPRAPPSGPVARALAALQERAACRAAAATVINPGQDWVFEAPVPVLPDSSAVAAILVPAPRLDFVPEGEEDVADACFGASGGETPMSPHSIYTDAPPLTSAPTGDRTTADQLVFGSAPATADDETKLPTPLASPAPISPAPAAAAAPPVLVPLDSAVAAHVERARARAAARAQSRRMQREALLSQAEHFGQTPQQLFVAPHPPRLGSTGGGAVDTRPVSVDAPPEGSSRTAASALLSARASGQIKAPRGASRAGKSEKPASTTAAAAAAAASAGSSKARSAAAAVAAAAEAQRATAPLVLQSEHYVGADALALLLFTDAPADTARGRNSDSGSSSDSGGSTSGGDGSSADDDSADNDDDAAVLAAAPAALWMHDSVAARGARFALAALSRAHDPVEPVGPAAAAAAGAVAARLRARPLARLLPRHAFALTLTGSGAGVSGASSSARARAAARLAEQLVERTDADPEAGRAFAVDVALDGGLAAAEEPGHGPAAVSRVQLLPVDAGRTHRRRKHRHHYGNRARRGTDAAKTASAASAATAAAAAAAAAGSLAAAAAPVPAPAGAPPDSSAAATAAGPRLRRCMQLLTVTLCAATAPLPLARHWPAAAVTATLCGAAAPVAAPAAAAAAAAADGSELHGVTVTAELPQCFAADALSTLSETRIEAGAGGHQPLPQASAALAPALAVAPGFVLTHTWSETAANPYFALSLSPLAMAATTAALLALAPRLVASAAAFAAAAGLAAGAAGAEPTRSEDASDAGAAAAVSGRRAQASKLVFGLPERSVVPLSVLLAAASASGSHAITLCSALAGNIAGVLAALPPTRAHAAALTDAAASAAAAAPSTGSGGASAPTLRRGASLPPPPVPTPSPADAEPLTAGDVRAAVASAVSVALRLFGTQTVALAAGPDTRAPQRAAAAALAAVRSLERIRSAGKAAALDSTRRRGAPPIIASSGVTAAAPGYQCDPAAPVVTAWAAADAFLNSARADAPALLASAPLFDPAANSAGALWPLAVALPVSEAAAGEARRVADAWDRVRAYQAVIASLSTAHAEMVAAAAVPPPLSAPPSLTPAALLSQPSAPAPASTVHVTPHTTLLRIIPPSISPAPSTTPSSHHLAKVPGLLASTPLARALNASAAARWASSAAALRVWERATAAWVRGLWRRRLEAEAHAMAAQAAASMVLMAVQGVLQQQQQQQQMQLQQPQLSPPAVSGAAVQPTGRLSPYGAAASAAVPGGFDAAAQARAEHASIAAAFSSAATEHLAPAVAALALSPSQRLARHRAISGAGAGSALQAYERAQVELRGRWGALARRVAAAASAPLQQQQQQQQQQRGEAVASQAPLGSALAATRGRRGARYVISVGHADGTLRVTQVSASAAATKSSRQAVPRAVVSAALSAVTAATTRVVRAAAAPALTAAFPRNGSRAGDIGTPVSVSSAAPAAALIGAAATAVARGQPSAGVATSATPAAVPAAASAASSKAKEKKKRKGGFWPWQRGSKDSDSDSDQSASAAPTAPAPAATAAATAASLSALGDTGGAYTDSESDGASSSSSGAESSAASSDSECSEPRRRRADERRRRRRRRCELRKLAAVRAAHRRRDLALRESLLAQGLSGAGVGGVGLVQSILLPGANCTGTDAVAAVVATCVAVTDDAAEAPEFAVCARRAASDGDGGDTDGYEDESLPALLTLTGFASAASVAGDVAASKQGAGSVAGAPGEVGYDDLLDDNDGDSAGAGANAGGASARSAAAAAAAAATARAGDSRQRRAAAAAALRLRRLHARATLTSAAVGLVDAGGAHAALPPVCELAATGTSTGAVLLWPVGFSSAAAAAPTGVVAAALAAGNEAAAAAVMPCGLLVPQPRLALPPLSPSPGADAASVRVAAVAVSRRVNVLAAAHADGTCRLAPLDPRAPADTVMRTGNCAERPFETDRRFTLPWVAPGSIHSVLSADLIAAGLAGAVPGPVAAAPGLDFTRPAPVSWMCLASRAALPVLLLYSRAARALYAVSVPDGVLVAVASTVVLREVPIGAVPDAAAASGDPSQSPGRRAPPQRYLSVLSDPDSGVFSAFTLTPDHKRLLAGGAAAGVPVGASTRAGGSATCGTGLVVFDTASLSAVSSTPVRAPAPQEAPLAPLPLLHPQSRACSTAASTTMAVLPPATPTPFGHALLLLQRRMFNTAYLAALHSLQRAYAAAASPASQATPSSSASPPPLLQPTGDGAAPPFVEAYLLSLFASATRGLHAAVADAAVGARPMVTALALAPLSASRAAEATAVDADSAHGVEGAAAALAAAAAGEWASGGEVSALTTRAVVAGLSDGTLQVYGRAAQKTAHKILKRFDDLDF
jgi:hypothetical protein